MIAEALKKALLQAAIEGKLTEQLPEDGDARDLLKEIQKEKEGLIKEGKIKKEKPLSEITDDEIPFDIPENWVWTRLQEISTINPRNQIPDDTVVSFVPMRLISEGYKNQFNHEQSLWKDVKSGFTHFADNDIVVAKITPCFENRKSVVTKGLLNSYGAGTTELHVIRPINNYVESEYLLFLLKTEYFISGGKLVMTGTAGQQRVGKKYIQELMCPIAPLTEQKRIIDLINSLLSEIENLEEDEQKLDYLEREFPGRVRSSILQAAIQGKLTEQLREDGDARELLKEIQKEKARLIKEGKIKKQKSLPAITEDEIPFEIPENWVWVRLGEIAINARSGGTPDTKNSKYYGGKIPFVTIKDMTMAGKYIEDTLSYITELGLDNSSAWLVEKNHILYSMYASIGKVSINTIPLATSQAIIVLQLIDNEVFRNYIYFFLRSMEALIYQFAAGTTQLNINAKIVKELLVPLPPLLEQKRIHEKLEELLPLCEQLE